MIYKTWMMINFNYSISRDKIRKIRFNRVEFIDDSDLIIAGVTNLTPCPLA